MQTFCRYTYISIFILIRHHNYHRSMFCAKLLCETIDSLNNFEMLHFHFDRWLYKIVSVILLLIYILVTIYSLYIYILAEYATFKKNI